MNKKIFKTGLAISSLGALVAPLATVIACGTKKDQGVNFFDVETLNTGGYSGSMTKLASGDISIAGSWGDSRFYAKENASSLHVVGVEKKRISNDGIQVKPQMKVSDQVALQNLFQDLIKYANNEDNKELRMQLGNKEKSIFNVYSHDDYKPLFQDDQIAIIDPENPNGDLKNVNAGKGNFKFEKFSTFDSNNADFFSDSGTATQTAKTKTDLKNEYNTKKQLRIVFIPSSDPAKVRAATKKLSDFLNDEIGLDVQIDVSTDYETAATQLESGQFEVAFLPVETWIKNAPNTNFILQAARPTQVSTMDITEESPSLPGTKFVNEKDHVELFNKYGQLYLKDITTEALGKAKLETNQKTFKKAIATGSEAEVKIQTFANDAIDNNPQDLLIGSYEAWLYTKKDSELDQILKEKYKTPNWTMPYADVKDKVIYGYTSKTSGASYLFPELWFNEHFTK